MPLSTLPLTDAAMKLPNNRAMRALKRIGIIQAAQSFEACRDLALSLRNNPSSREEARRWAAHARHDWAALCKALFA